MAWRRDYTKEPIEGIRGATELVFVMGSAPVYLQKLAPTRKAAEDYIDNYLATRMPPLDANDVIYQYDASRNYNPAAKLGTITVPVLWINSADDYINPPELGIAEKMVGQMPHAKFILIPISDATRGHGTHTQAVVWKDYLAEFMRQTETR